MNKRGVVAGAETGGQLAATVVAKGEVMPPMDRGLPLPHEPAGYEKPLLDPKDHTQLAHALDWWAAKLDGSLTRTPQPDGTIVLQMHTKDGDSFGGRGATTKDAGAALIAKLKGGVK